MSLIRKRRMTPRRLAAIRRNQKLSRGPATPEGRKRLRDAHLRHGFYSKTDEAALRALGEDPADFRDLLEALANPRTVAAEVQECLGERLARSYWRMKRAERMQDGYALRQAKEEGYAREGRLHMQMMRLKMISRNWERLAQAVARPHYLTTPADLDTMRHLHKEAAAKEMSEVALALFYQLREPGRLKPGDEGFESEEELAKRRRVMNQIRGIFGLSPLRGPEGQETAESAEPQEGPQEAGAAQSDVGLDSRPTHADASVGSGQAPEVGAAQPEAQESDPYAKITEEQWQAREPVRQLLENLLTRQVEIFEARHRELLRESLAGPSPQERAAEIVPSHPDSKFMQRMEDSNFRQITRLTSLIIRMKRLERLKGNGAV